MTNGNSSARMAVVLEAGGKAHAALQTAPGRPLMHATQFDAGSGASIAGELNRYAGHFNADVRPVGVHIAAAPSAPLEWTRSLELPHVAGDLDQCELAGLRQAVLVGGLFGDSGQPVADDGENCAVLHFNWTDDRVGQATAEWVYLDENMSSPLDLQDRAFSLGDREGPRQRRLDRLAAFGREAHALVSAGLEGRTVSGVVLSGRVFREADRDVSGTLWRAYSALWAGNEEQRRPVRLLGVRSAMHGALGLDIAA